MQSHRALLLVALVSVTAGCDLYFEETGPAPCNAVADDLGETRRNPANATCVRVDGVACDDRCGACVPYTDEAALGAAYPDWGSCNSHCTGLDARSCQATAGCYAAFDQNPYTNGSPEYGGCWKTSDYAYETGSCEALGAFDCAARQDCSLLYTDYDTHKLFALCIAEPFSDACAATDCGPGYHCEEQCTADGGQPGQMGKCGTVCVEDASCSAIDCGPGYTCALVCDDTATGGVCHSTCVPTTSHDPGACTGPVSCFTNAPACPSGTTAGIRNGCWTGYCIPNAACGPSDPGQCYAPVTCDSVGPACPSGTTPGIGPSGCWTGYCIPVADCGAQACSTLASEAACEARMDCRAVYAGMSCTCTASGCTCQTVTFDHCEQL